MIRFENVSKTYKNGTPALKDINLDIEKGEFVAIMGPSGSGKSTCMNIAGFLDEPTSGTYRFRGHDTTYLGRDQRALLRRHSVRAGRRCSRLAPTLHPAPRRHGRWEPRPCHHRHHPLRPQR